MLSLNTTLYNPIMFFFFFNDTATTEIYTLSLHDALPISLGRTAGPKFLFPELGTIDPKLPKAKRLERLAEVVTHRSEEHTSELPSHSDLVWRPLLVKKKKKTAYRRRREYIMSIDDVVTSS